MKRMSLSWKAWSIVGLLWISLLLMVVANAIMTRTSMLDDRKGTLTQQAQIAMGVVAYYQKRAVANELPLDEAKRLAIATLRGLRYGPDHSGYFGIYDSSAVAILVPPKPELESMNQTDLVDPRGTHIAVEIIKSSSTGGSHFSTYVWPKHGDDAPVPKLSYSDTFPAWDWHLFTGVYIDDIDVAFREALFRNLVLVGLIGLAITLGMLWLIRSIKTSLGGEPDYAANLCKQIASGDLTATFELVKNDRGSLLYAMDKMQQQLSGTVRQIHRAAESISTGANEIAAGNMDLSSRTEQQAASLEETAASMEELTATVRHNTDNARQGNLLAVNASEIAARGGKVVRRVIETMRDISSTSARVEQITGVIDGIAFQTNILALNAAVEAARAGEQGRGFAVVASEVRNLAQRSASAAKEIKDLIDQSVGKVSEGSKLVDEAGATIDEVVASAKRVADLMGEISAASEQQHAGIEQVNDAVAQMDHVTQQNAALVEEAAAASRSLEEQGRQLTQAISAFRLVSS
jgi:methyl-accepting chemotaxis protein